MKNLSKVIVAAVVGVAAGGALGVLFAPEKGSKTRKDFSKKGKKFFDNIENVSKEKLMEIKENLEAKISKINDRINKIAEVS